MVLIFDPSVHHHRPVTPGDPTPQPPGQPTPQPAPTPQPMPPAEPPPVRARAAEVFAGFLRLSCGA